MGEGCVCVYILSIDPVCVRFSSYASTAPTAGQRNFLCVCVYFSLSLFRLFLQVRHMHVLQCFLCLQYPRQPRDGRAVVFCQKCPRKACLRCQETEVSKDRTGWVSAEVDSPFVVSLQGGRLQRVQCVRGQNGLGECRAPLSLGWGGVRARRPVSVDRTGWVGGAVLPSIVRLGWFKRRETKVSKD